MGRRESEEGHAGGGKYTEAKGDLCGTEEGSVPAAKSRANPKWKAGGSHEALQTAWRTGSELSGKFVRCLKDLGFDLHF